DSTTSVLGGGVSSGPAGVGGAGGGAVSGPAGASGGGGCATSFVGTTSSSVPALAGEQTASTSPAAMPLAARFRRTEGENMIDGSAGARGLLGVRIDTRDADIARVAGGLREHGGECGHRR